MHGRRRVPRTEEEMARQRKEKQVEMAAYRTVMDLIFSKRKTGDHLVNPSEMMDLTGQVLLKNPDIHTLWNIRKEVLAHMKEDNVDHFDGVVSKELDFTEWSLKRNPKSYGAWHHRTWLVKQNGFKNVQEELRLCTKYLEFDERNFHTWDYRQFLVDNSESETLEKELEYTTRKIVTNFSNFSSWHLRSKVLPQIRIDYLKGELELIRNALFTDPDDQSSWLYHLWLLKYHQLKPEFPKLVLIKRTDQVLILCFNVAVPTPRDLADISVSCGVEDSNWRNPLSTHRSKLWTMNISSGDVTISGQYVRDWFDQESLTLGVGEGHVRFDSYFDEETKPKDRAFEAILRQELVWVREIGELEPDVKWPFFTALTLMRMINFVEFQAEIGVCVKQLKKIDPNRTNYYIDLQSKFTIELQLVGRTGTEKEVDLRGLGLSSLYYPERLCLAEVVNCADNSLKNISSIPSFLCCTTLDLRNNRIPVSSQSFMGYIKSLPRLKSLTISGNPGSVDEGLCPNVKFIY